MGKLEWNLQEGEGVIVFSSQFKTAHRVEQLDALVDWIRALEDKYDEMLSINKKDKNEKSQSE